MNRILVFLSLMLTVVAPPVPSYAQNAADRIHRWTLSLEEQRKSGRQSWLSGTRRAPIITGKDVTVSLCPQEAQDFGASCGYVLVPLDRFRPHGEEIGIYFEVYGHSNPGPAGSVILINFGGPGSGTTTNRDLALSIQAQS
jgi:hypothetical protein